MFSPPKEDFTDSFSDCLSDLEHIYKQTDSTREQSPFVPSDSGMDSMNIQDCLELIGLMLEMNDGISRTVEHLRLCRWGYALWDYECLVILEDDISTGYDWAMDLLYLDVEATETDEAP